MRARPARHADEAHVDAARGRPAAATPVGLRDMVDDEDSPSRISRSISARFRRKEQVARGEPVAESREEEGAALAERRSLPGARQCLGAGGAGVLHLL